MRMVHNFYIILFIAVTAALIGGCGKEENTRQLLKEEETGIQIGMIFDNFVMERWQRDRDVFVSTAKELGAEVNVQNANSSVEEQIHLIEYFIKKKVDVIVIIPIDSKPLLESVKKAQEEGIRVVSYDRLIIGAQPDLYISFDNRKVGTLMGNAISEKLGENDKILMICGPETDNNAIEVQNGFKEVMDAEKIEILDIYHVDGWKPEYAAMYVRANSDLIRDAKGIMCGNDNVAGQVISALAEQRLAGEIYVTGQDADLAACQRIVEGTQYMTVYKSIEKMAAEAAKVTVDLAEDKEIDYGIFQTEDGKKIRYIRMEPVAVNAENIQEVIIDSGFHLKEDVYLNRPDLLE